MKDIVSTYNQLNNDQFFKTEDQPQLVKNLICFSNVESISFCLYLFIGKENTIGDSYNLPLNHRVGNQQDLRNGNWLATVNEEAGHNALKGNEVQIIPYQLEKPKDNENNENKLKPWNIFFTQLKQDEDKSLVTWEIDNMVGSGIKKLLSMLS